MSFSKAAFGIQNIFSLASREQCMTNLKKLRIPSQYSSSQPNTALLVPLCSVNDQITVLFTIKKAKAGNVGQISFPGGKIFEKETPVFAALRHTESVIGLSSARVDVWGSGNSFPGQGKSTPMVCPVVGAVSDLKNEDLNINGNEVSEVFTVPIETLCDPKNQYYTQYRDGFVLPVFVADEYKIWGMTAFITHTLLSCLLPKEVYKNNWLKKKIVLKESNSPLQAA